MKYTIDAQGKKLGRVASEAASVLMGKNSAAFARNQIASVTVEIANAGRTDITAHKKASDSYVTYTGHRGGLNKESLGELIARQGMREVYQRAVRRMLPDNKLRDGRMKNLIIKE
ncbi:MAG: uL13 family ribosomal protein [Patescibacteria group bacterium]|nr:uL13 family ribosomal protein [Patescibacteria group bacterium]